MKPKTALLLLNGELRAPRRVRAAARTADILVCADGGARHAKRLGLTPDFIVGDMDSLPKPVPRAWMKTRYWCDFNLERSDIDKSLDFIRARGVRRVTVAGAFGGGLDHELVNFASFETCAKEMELSVIGAGTALLLGCGRHRVALRPGARFSLLAAPRARLSLSGARYRLNNEVLVRGSRGLGNRAQGPVTLSLMEGRAWMLSAKSALEEL